MEIISTQKYALPIKSVEATIFCETLSHTRLNIFNKVDVRTKILKISSRRNLRPLNTRKPSFNSFFLKMLAPLV